MSAISTSPQPDIVAFANDWDTDPTSKHHLMRLLALRAPVLWVETAGMRRPQFGKARDWSRVAAKLRKMFGAVRDGAPNLRVLTPPSLPLPTNPVARAANARLYGWSIRRALGTHARAATPMLWVYAPTVARYLDQFSGWKVVYHCVDRWWAFSDYDASEMQTCHEILCRRAEHVFASSRELERDCLDLTDRVTYVPHGVAWDHFRQAVDGGESSPERRPRRIGFIGMIDDWVDVELLAAVARQHPDAEVIVVGAWRIPDAALDGLPNVRLLGRRPFAELPQHLATFDVALVPFRINDLTRAVNPVKLREYLSAGVPVVSTALPELSTFAGHEGVDIAADHAAFLAAVARRLEAPPDLITRRRLSDQMRAESWEARLDMMLDELGHGVAPVVSGARA